MSYPRHDKNPQEPYGPEDGRLAREQLEPEPSTGEREGVVAAELGRSWAAAPHISL